MCSISSPDLISLTRRMVSIEEDTAINPIHSGQVEFNSRYGTDWLLNLDILVAVNEHLGPLEVDLLASRFSAQL